jgi:hypothetical protein
MACGRAGKAIFQGAARSCGLRRLRACRDHPRASVKDSRQGRLGGCATADSPALFRNFFWRNRPQKHKTRLGGGVGVPAKTARWLEHFGRALSGSGVLSIARGTQRRSARRIFGHPWMRRAALDGSLAAFLNPSLATPEHAVAVEGWISRSSVIIINPAMPPEQDRRRTERTQKRRKINAGVRSRPFSLFQA